MRFFDGFLIELHDNSIVIIYFLRDKQKGLFEK